MMFTVCKGKQGGMETGEGTHHGTALPGCHRPHRAWLGRQLALGTHGIHLGKPSRREGQKRRRVASLTLG